MPTQMGNGQSRQRRQYEALVLQSPQKHSLLTPKSPLGGAVKTGLKALACFDGKIARRQKARMIFHPQANNIVVRAAPKRTVPVVEISPSQNKSLREFFMKLQKTAQMPRILQNHILIDKIKTRAGKAKSPIPHVIKWNRRGRLNQPGRGKTVQNQTAGCAAFLSQPKNRLPKIKTQILPPKGKEIFFQYVNTGLAENRHRQLFSFCKT